MTPAPGYCCSRNVSSLLAFLDGSAAAGSDRRRSPSCYAAGERVTSDSRQRCRAPYLPRAAARVFATLRSLGAGLLPHVESRAPDRDSANPTGPLAVPHNGINGRQVGVNNHGQRFQRYLFPSRDLHPRIQQSLSLLHNHPLLGSRRYIFKKT
jgi:hypothetical protein